MKKIISVKFDDGTERKVDDADLRRYLEQLDIEATCVHLGPGFKWWELKPVLEAIQTAQQHEKSVTNTANASKRRSLVTKEQLEAFRDAFEIKEGKVHGWKAKACECFLIDPGTLKSILDRA